MTAATIRNTTLPVLALLVGVAVFLPKHPEPKIQCSPEKREGQRYWCSVELAYPPEQPDFSWSVIGDCQVESLAGQSILLTATPGDGKKRCTANVIVRDMPNGPIIGRANDTTVTFLPTTQTESSSASNIPEAQHDTSVKSRRPPRLLDFSPPDDKLRSIADAAAVHGQVDGMDLSTYMVAFYTQTPAGWTLQGDAIPIKVIGRETGIWEVNAAFGSAYAVVLGKRSFKPEPSLHSLPRPGNGIVEVKMIR